MRWFKSIGLSICVCVAMSQAAWAAVEVLATVDKEEVYMDETVMYSLKVIGAKGHVEDPLIPVFKGFRSTKIGTSMLIVNGHKEVSYKYRLKPEIPGDYSFAPSTVIIDGQRYRSQSIPIIVHEGSNPDPQSSYNGRIGSKVVKPMLKPTTAEDDNPDLAFVTVDVDKTEAYVNEQITMIFRFYRRVALLENHIYNEPNLEGFQKIDILPRRVKAGHYKDFEYIIQEIKTALFPLRSGELEIGSSGIECVLSDTRSQLHKIFGMRQFVSGGSGQRVHLRSKPIKINVKPLPERGRPADFNGLVGSFKVKSVLNKKNIVQGDGVNLKVQLVGHGLVKGITLPNIHLKGLKLYPSSTEYGQVEKYDNSVWSKNTYELALVAESSGSYTIPEIVFPYFNPETHAYEFARTKPIDLMVEPSSEEQKENAIVDYSDQDSELEALNPAVSEQMRYLKTDLGVNQKSKWPLWIWFLMLLIGPAVFIVIVLYQKRRLQSLQQMDDRRYRRAYSYALKELKLARKMLKQNHQSALSDHVSQAIRGFVADRMKVSSQSLTDDQIEIYLLQQKVDASVKERVFQVLNQSDQVRFAEGEKSMDLNEYLNQSEKLLKILKKVSE